MTDCMLLSLSLANLDEVLDDFPAARQRIESIAHERLREVTQSDTRQGRDHASALASHEPKRRWRLAWCKHTLLRRGPSKIAPGGGTERRRLGLPRERHTQSRRGSAPPSRAGLPYLLTGLAAPPTAFAAGTGPAARQAVRT